MIYSNSTLCLLNSRGADSKSRAPVNSRAPLKSRAKMVQNALDFKGVATFSPIAQKRFTFAISSLDSRFQHKKIRQTCEFKKILALQFFSIARLLFYLHRLQISVSWSELLPARAPVLADLAQETLEIEGVFKHVKRIFWFIFLFPFTM